MPDAIIEPLPITWALERNGLDEHDLLARFPKLRHCVVSKLFTTFAQLALTVVINGVVGNNTKRKLRVSEFRGFAVCDGYAPFLFVNGADSKSAQMFTIVHELAHVWLGPDASGVSGFDRLLLSGERTERFCNQVAASFLLPTEEFRQEWNLLGAHDGVYEKLARIFKVSPLVIARRALDLSLLSRKAYFAFYDRYVAQERHKRNQASGGVNATAKRRIFDDNA